MEHPLFTQLKFARSEFMRCIAGITDEEALVRHGQMNCISWIVGHMANQEQFFWMYLAQNRFLDPTLNSRVGTGEPASTPPLQEMLETWQRVIAEADVYLSALTQDMMQMHLRYQDKDWAESIGTMLYRNTYHYWFHTGEAHAIRQILGHADLPQFVGNMQAAVYRPEE